MLIQCLAGPSERSATASVELREGGRHPRPTFDCCVSRPAVLLYGARHGRIIVRGAAPGRTIVHGDVRRRCPLRARACIIDLRCVECPPHCNNPRWCTVTNPLVRERESADSGRRRWASRMMGVVENGIVCRRWV